MAAIVRGVTSGHSPVGPGQVTATPDGATRAGDQLYAIHTAIGGTADQMTAPTPGTWAPVRTDDSGAGSLHVKMWRCTLSSVPSSVTAAHGTADGTLHLATVAGASAGAPQITVEIQAGGGQVLTLEAVPASPSGVELRVGAVFVQSGGSPVWGAPAGYPGVASAYSGQFATSGVTFKTVTSTNALPEAAFGLSGPEILTAYGYTIIIPSSSGSAGGGETPTPIPFPSFTPTKGVARTSYTVHDFLTGEFRGDIYPADPTYGRRDGEADGWLGFLPIANRRAADRIAEIIPRDPEDLTSGPGRLVVHSWRDGVLCGIHWIHTAEIAKTSRLGLGVRLQGTTLDGYMNSVSLESDVEFVGDQIANARDFILHMSADGRSSPGFTLQGGTSGLVRPLTAKRADNTTYGRVLRDYARVNGGFGYVIDPTVTTQGAIERRWRWGSPAPSLPDSVWTFVEGRDGGEITDWKEIRSALQGGTRIGVIGGTPEATDATQDRVAVRSQLIETPHLGQGWPIIDLRVNHPAASTDLTELERYALRYAATAAGAPRVFSANVILGKGSVFDPNGIGSWVEFVMNNDWHVRTAQGGAFQMPLQRLIGWSLTPASRGSGKDKLQIVTAQEAP
ncbi:hypothetical protein [Streptosporangium sp. NPDC051022]|uniref:hypothetical protein n=1 Tax=Streptosporangium sp. NPDC051022 TaxID=3155752 RepID=UPI0034155E0F